MSPVGLSPELGKLFQDRDPRRSQKLIDRGRDGDKAIKGGRLGNKTVGASGVGFLNIFVLKGRGENANGDLAEVGLASYPAQDGKAIGHRHF